MYGWLLDVCIVLEAVTIRNRYKTIAMESGQNTTLFYDLHGPTLDSVFRCSWFLDRERFWDHIHSVVAASILDNFCLGCGFFLDGVWRSLGVVTVLGNVLCIPRPSA